MMDIHALTPQGEVLVVQVVDGQAIVPPTAESKCQDFANIAHETRMGAQIPQVRFPPPPPVHCLESST